MIGLALALVLVWLAGLGAAALLAGRTRLLWPEWLGLAWPLGAGVISLAIWLFGLVCSDVVLRGGIAALAVGLALLGWRAWRKNGAAPQAPGWSDLPLLVVVAGLAGYVVWLGPKVCLGWDALMIWEAKARLAWQQGGTLPVTYFADADRTFSQPFYPLYLPYLEAWWYGWQGSPDQSVLWLIPLCFVVAAALLLYGAVRRLGGPPWLGWMAAAALLAVPYLFSGVWGLFAGYADFPLAVLFLGAVGAALWWTEDRAPAALRLLAVLAALLPWVKREGRFLWFGLILVPLLVLVVLRRWREALLLVAPGVVLMAAWQTYLSFCHVVPDPTFAPVTFSAAAERWHRVGPIASAIGAELVLQDHWSILWPLTALAILSFAIARRWLIAALLATALAAPLSGALAAYLFSTSDNYFRHIELSIPRLIVQLAPAALLMVVLACPWRRQQGEKADGGG